LPTRFIRGIPHSFLFNNTLNKNKLQTHFIKSKFMATQIERKVQQLRNDHFDLGNQLSNETDCGHGGRLQKFSNANIYYHPVMDNEAHEVHGGILTKYLALGGHDVNHASGQRLLGFPLSDEKDSDDGMCVVSRFEWGAIYWAFNGVVVYGKIYEEYLATGGEKGRFGYPITDPVTISEGLVVFFEHGCMYQGTKGQGRVIQMNYQFPQLGHPWMIKGSEIAARNVISFNFFNAASNTMNRNIAGNLFHDIFKGRIFLKETAGTNEIALTFDPLDAKQNMFDFSSVIKLQGTPILKNNQLYDIILKFSNQVHSIAPHSVYIKDGWNNFKFTHVTDIHVSRRLDGFRKFFNDRGMEAAAKNFNNFNDNFRQFIRYANKLHKKGELDFIMMTGDLVDYVFEDGPKTQVWGPFFFEAKTYHNNNFVYFESIIRGLTGKPDQVQNEELKVPVFTSLGNHDYRTRAYYPLFEVDVPGSNETVEQFGPFNITRDEAKIVTEDLLHVTHTVSTDTSIDMIKPDRENRGGNLDYYFRHICRESSYIVALGNHQVVMIDGKWDDGTIEGTWDAIKYYLGFRGEATDNFAGGSPDSVGFVAAEFDMVRGALQKNGLVIIGVHAPLINPKYSEYSYYMREYLRTINPQPYTNEIRKYLFRQDPGSFRTSWFNQTIVIDLTRDVHSGWSRQRTSYFHKGNGDDLLDYGVMRGNQEEFLKLCSGVKNSTRPADLILSGHVHNNWECRLAWDAPSQKFNISHDFYTENPAVYYHSYDTDVKTDEAFFVYGVLTDYMVALKKLIKDKQIRIHVKVTEDAQVDEKPVKDSSGIWSIRTKPYPKTLDSQVNNAQCRSWWQNARPLLVQTAALGPSKYMRVPEESQPDFRGCRLITVASDTIEKIHYVTRDEIKKALLPISMPIPIPGPIPKVPIERS
jgi:hypothetical protein